MAEKREEDYILDKTMTCEVCNRQFKTKVLRTGKARFLGTDEILKPLYDGIDATKYDVILCPLCGYAASARNYGHLTPVQRKSIRETVSPKFEVKWKEESTYSYDVAIKRVKMAVLTEMVTHGKISESAYLCLKLAWLYEGEINELEKRGVPEEFIKQYKKYKEEYLKDAYEGFKQAVAKEYPPICGMDEMTVNYLLTSLAVECKEYSEAKKFASMILGSRTANSKLKEKTRMVIERIE